MILCEFTEISILFIFIIVISQSEYAYIGVSEKMSMQYYIV